ncbi:MAG TPA: MBL fold metallo-hydrolase, partial [Candidatus Polarisedimenticolaceae bacterium]|nr:MBL fold metallo-hydrolase [Candidatus Polarisedimenticolaceae bacterium]
QGRVFLLDATPDLRAQLEALRDARRGVAGAVDRAPVAGILLTHAHLGHYTGLGFFGFEAIHSQHLPVWCSPRLAAYLRANGPWSQLVERGNVDLREVALGAEWQLEEGVWVTAFAVPHRDELSDTLAYRLRGRRATVLYVPDTDGWEPWSPPLEERLDGVDVALLDGTFFSDGELGDRDVRAIGHPRIVETLQRLGRRLREDRLRVYFTHLNHSNPALDPDSAARKAIVDAGAAVLEDGQEFPL